MTRDMTTGSPLKIILLFTIPVLLGNFFQQFYTVADSIIVGRILGEEALAAVGSTGSLVFFVIGFCIGIANGFGIVIAQAYGAKKEEELKHYVAVSIMLGFIVSILMTVVTVAISRRLLIWMNSPENILELANSYITIIYAGIIATTFFNIASAMLRGIGDSKTPLYFLIFSSILSIILSYLFIAAFRMGPAGAALATVIAQGVSAILCLAYMFHKFELLRFSRTHFYMDLNSVRKLLYLGIPMAINFSVTAFGIMILQSGVNVFGSTVVAAFVAATRIEGLAMQPMIALGVTMSNYCGQNFGAGEYGRIFDGMRKALIMIIVLAGVFALVCIGFGNFMTGWFLQEPTKDILLHSNTYLRTVSWFSVPLAFIFLYRSALQGLGKGMVSLMAGILELIGRFVMIFFFLEIHGFIIACLASPAAWIITGIPLLFVYLHWKKKTIAIQSLSV